MLLITSHFILWLLQTSCSIFIDVACYNHSRVFYACCTISMHITVILVVMLKSAILLPKNSMCPILPLNKNYLRNYLETKNYLEVPEWQDDSWSGNCSYVYRILHCPGFDWFYLRGSRTMKRFPFKHHHRIDQIPKPIAVENINTHHLVEKSFINSWITLRDMHNIIMYNILTWPSLW